MIKACVIAEDIIDKIVPMDLKDASSNLEFSTNTKDIQETIEEKISEKSETVKCDLDANNFISKKSDALSCLKSAGEVKSVLLSETGETKWRFINKRYWVSSLVKDVFN